jgi:FkbM family methyltransferase
MRRLLRTIGRWAKPVLTRTLYRPGRVARILYGPSKGLKYRIFPGYGLSMIYGGWEPEVHEMMAQSVPAGSVVYDLGANYGIYTMLLSRLAGPTGFVYAFEPMPQIMKQLQANIDLNRQTNVKYIPRAVADRAGTASFSVGVSQATGHLTGQGTEDDRLQQSVTVEVTTLDEFVRQGHRPPTFIKIDVEGAEGLVFDGAREVLARYRPTLAVEIHSPEQGDRVGRALRDADYTAFLIHEGMKPVTRYVTDASGPSDVQGYVLARPRTASRAV